MTGFEGTILSGIAIFFLGAFLWRSLGRHVTVNNTNSPSATASASSQQAGQGSTPVRSALGWLTSLLIVVVVIILAVAAFDLRASLSTDQPAQVESKVITPIPTIAAPTPLPVVEEPAPYAPVALPNVNTTFDLTPIILLAAVAAGLWFISRRSIQPAKIKTVDPVIINPISPAHQRGRDTDGEPIPISADRPLQEVMSKRKS